MTDVEALTAVLKEIRLRRRKWNKKGCGEIATGINIAEGIVDLQLRLLKRERKNNE